MNNAINYFVIGIYGAIKFTKQSLKNVQKKINKVYNLLDLTLTWRGFFFSEHVFRETKFLKSGFDDYRVLLKRVGIELNDVFAWRLCLEESSIFQQIYHEYNFPKSDEQPEKKNGT